MSAPSTKLGLLKLGVKIALPVLALFVGISSFKALTTNRPSPPKPQKREVVQPVRTSKITLSSHQPWLKLYGEIKTGRKLELRTLVGGKVVKTEERFRNGSLVKKGDVLFSIDPFSYEGAVVEARANITEARARLKENTVQIKAEETSITYALEQLRLAKRDLERAQKLMRKGSVTRQGGDQRALIVSQRRQTLESKRANLAILRAKAEQQSANIASLEWRLRQAVRNQKDTVLKAPFNGYINEINANVGKLLNVNDRVAVLLDSDWMEAVFTLSDQQYGRLLESSNSAAVGQGTESSNSAAVGQGTESSNSAAVGQGRKSSNSAAVGQRTAPSNSAAVGQETAPLNSAAIGQGTASSNSAAIGQYKQPKGGLAGRIVKITWKLGETSLTYRGVVERTGAQISSESGGVSIYARLLNPSKPLPVRAGAFVDIEVPDRVYHKVARLPQTSLYDRSKVYVVGPDKRLHERLVKLRAIDGEFALVSGDLADGDRVVVTRMSVIGGGMKVKDLDRSSDSPKKSGRSGPLTDAKGRQGSRWKAGKEGDFKGRPDKKRPKQHHGDRRDPGGQEPNNRG